MKWLPIETAPSDGTPFLSESPDLIGGMAMVYKKPEEKVLRSICDGRQIRKDIDGFTMWCPLPEIPEESNA